MKNLIKCHLNYLISKTTIIVSMIVVLIFLIGSLSSVFTLDKTLGFADNNYLYFYNIYIISKLVIIIFSIFLFGFSFLSKSDQYIAILVASGISRIKIIVSKILAVGLVILLVCYLAYFQYMLIGLLFYKNFIFNLKYFFAFISLFLLAIFYGLLSLILIQLFDNIYTIIIPFALMNLSEIMNEDINVFIKILNFLIPVYRELEFYYGSFHIILLIICLFIINIYYYNWKDFKS